MQLNDVYKNKVGSAKIDVKEAVVDQKVNLTITYKVGKIGIDDGGAFKVLYKIISDCGDVQFNDKKADNFVNISSSNKNVKFIPLAKSTGLLGRVHRRPWSKGFIVLVTNSYLKENDDVIIKFKNWRMQTFLDKFRIKLLVDPFATNRFIEVPSNLEINLLPDEPKKVVILAPVQVEKNKNFSFLIKLEDKWGNPCINKNGYFSIENSDEFKGLNNRIFFKNGKAAVTTKVGSNGIYVIKAEYNNLQGISNPIIVKEFEEYKFLYADLHGQSEETVGTKKLSDYIKFARDYSFLDVTSIQPNDFEITNDFWKEINKLSKSITESGKFIMFPGYEWSGNTAVGGDRNVIYKEEGFSIYRSSHANLEDFSDLDTDAETVDILFKKLPDKKSLVIGHIGGRYANLDFHNEKKERLLEVYSDWGCFEWFLFDALNRGYKVGIVANSDDHTGRLGASYPTKDHFNNIGGLTCILAKKFDRENVFDALYKRHCYATTGVRLYLYVSLIKNGKTIAIMGDNVNEDVVKAKLHIKTVTNSSIDRIEVFDKSKLIKSFYSSVDNKDCKYIKIVWSGSKVKGRKRDFIWKGKLELEGNKIYELEPINFYEKSDHLIEYTNNYVNWKGKTTGGVQGFIIKIKNKESKVKLNVNNKSINLNLNEILNKGKRYSMGGIDGLLQIYQVGQEKQMDIFEKEVELSNLNKDTHAIFVKVTLRNGHFAWSSPIFI